MAKSIFTIHLTCLHRGTAVHENDFVTCTRFRTGASVVNHVTCSGEASVSCSARWGMAWMKEANMVTHLMREIFRLLTPRSRRIAYLHHWHCMCCSWRRFATGQTVETFEVPLVRSHPQFALVSIFNHRENNVASAHGSTSVEQLNGAVEQTASRM